LVDTFVGFAQNSFEERRAATCRFSKEFYANPGNVGRKGLNLKGDSEGTPSLQKSFANWKAFGVKRRKPINSI
jgi:hypothetical protein